MHISATSDLTDVHTGSYVFSLVGKVPWASRMCHVLVSATRNDGGLQMVDPEDIRETSVAEWWV